VASRISDGESDSNVVAGVRNSNEVAGIWSTRRIASRSVVDDAQKTTDN
jgi:hypothetical protein